MQFNVVYLRVVVIYKMKGLESTVNSQTKASTSMKAAYYNIINRKQGKFEISPISHNRLF